MKVIHIISGISKQSGGPSRSVQGLVSSLCSMGIDAVLVSCRVGETPWVNGIKKFHAPEKQGSLYLKRFFEKVFREEKPDLIHLNGIWQWNIHIAAKVARKLKIPYIETPHGMLEPWSLEQKKWKKKLAMWLYQRNDLRRAIALHSTAESEAEQFRQLGFQNRVIISPNGVNVPSVLPEKQRADNRSRALFVSRMHPKKCVKELVEAWAKVKPDNWCCELVYTLSSDKERAYELEVKELVKALNLESSFIFTGALSDERKWEAYTRADLFVLPTFSENFGIVIAEALYAGIPVITTKGAPWAELEERDCGKWIDLGVEPLVKALEEMIALTDDARKMMGERGRKLVDEKYTWSAVLQPMISGYKAILNN